MLEVGLAENRFWRLHSFIFEHKRGFGPHWYVRIWRKGGAKVLKIIVLWVGVSMNSGR